MGEAVFGLLGVVIGGLLTGAVSYVFERRRETRQTRADARLILMNYRVVGPYIDEAVEAGIWPPAPPNVEWSYNIWLNARPNLASTLSVKDWDTIEAGMRVIEESIADREAGNPIDSRDRVSLPTKAQTARQTVDVLARLGSRR